jgi:hypothetical protein
MVSKNYRSGKIAVKYDTVSEKNKDLKIDINNANN